MSSPTQRSLKWWRDLGYNAEVVEKWNPWSKTRKDLFGMFDILAFNSEGVVGIQTTSAGNIRARIKKLEECPLIKDWSINNLCIVEGWRKIKNRWVKVEYRYIGDGWSGPTEDGYVYREI